MTKIINDFVSMFVPISPVDRAMKEIHGCSAVRGLKQNLLDNYLFTLDNGILVCFAFNHQMVLVKKYDEIIFASDDKEEIEDIKDLLIAVSQKNRSK